MKPKPMPRKRRGLKPAELKKLEAMQAKSASRKLAYEILEKAKIQKNVRIAEELAKHPDWLVRNEALLALVNINPEKAIPLLEEIAKTNKSLTARKHAKGILKIIKYSKAKK